MHATNAGDNFVPISPQMMQAGLEALYRHVTDVDVGSDECCMFTVDNALSRSEKDHLDAVRDVYVAMEVARRRRG
jgi:hypothetical protein